MTNTHQELTGSTALVTGATSGIGKATALALASRGARVLVSGRDTERGDAVVAAIRANGGKADFLKADLDDAESTRNLARRALEIAGSVDILVNNAGIFPFGPTPETPLDAFHDVYATNVRAPYILVAELAPKMAERGNGAIVNVSSMVGDFGVAGMALYGSSKAALNLLTKSWAAEFGPKGVRVNAVSPGPTRTEGTEGMGDGLAQLAAMAPAGHPATPEEIADAIVYLVSDNASFVHGVVLPVDGGRAAV
jgi:NAD(P)-dependent dehydrogenase (short-subunit alcohol dehydrogenase family)